MDLIDKHIFLSNFKEDLDGRWVGQELTLLTSAIKREGIGNMKHPSTRKSQIQRLKQIVWLLEANYTDDFQ